MKCRLIVNPVSGTDTAPDALPLINQRLRERVGDMDIVMTVAAGDAEHAAERAANEGYDHLFIAGGDGTLNEALNGVARAGALDRVTLGLVPLGTGNDFAHALGLPSRVEEALDVLLGGRAVAVDVGQVNGRCFVNVSAGGFVAEVSDAVDPALKTFAGRLAYVIGGAQVLFDFEPVAASYRAAEASADASLELAMFAVCNSRLVGGGRPIAPRAVVDDGLLDVCLVRSMPALEFVGLLRRVAQGEHLDDPRVEYFQTSALSLRFARPIKINTDGEVLETETCAYRVLPRAVRVLVGETLPGLI